ncbi:NAD(P)-dependent oxidoreductase [Savagea faecisuis]|uniref:NAD(P)-dependent oxidoreductase n=1 Tax=Savagea faecisuis TaxID=1274803 RepID=A0ABW3H4A4_9BACL
MNITIFGATGRVGSLVMQRALDEGHAVTAFVRDASRLKQQPTKQVIGDVRVKEDVFQAIEGADLVVSALGTDKTTTLTEAIPSIIAAMKQFGVKRIVTVGTAGILQSRTDSSKVRYEAGDSNRKLTFAAEEHHRVYDQLKATSLDWTIVCPTYLPDGEATGKYRVEKDHLPVDGKMISVGDTAQFVYDELMNQKFNQSRVGIAY